MTLHEKIAELRRKKESAPNILFYIYKYSYTMVMYDTLNSHSISHFIVSTLALFGVAQYHVVISGHEST